MKIGFDAKRIFCNFRGLGNYSRTLVESLVRFHPEHEYYLFTPEIKDKRALHWLSQFESLNVITPQTKLTKLNKSYWRCFLLDKEIKKLKLDIYHGLSHELPRSIQKTGAKSVVTIHDVIFMRFPDFFPAIDRFIYKKKFSHAIEHADKIVSICEQTKRDIQHFLKGDESKIQVLFQSAHPRFYDLKKENELREIIKNFVLPKKFILFVGALEERKNVLTLVKAFERVKNNIKEDLILVGRGKAYKKELESYIEKRNLSDRVHILSNVEDHHLPSFYQLASVFTFPSVFEGWGVPIVDSLFSETPVITSKGSCFPESGGPHSIYVDPYSVDSLSSAIERVLKSDELKEVMKREGRKYAEQFHWRETSTKLISLYESLLISN